MCFILVGLYSHLVCNILINKKKQGESIMIAMQYKVKLLDNFDMNIIRKRVIDNGRKTDGFQDLIFKTYLIAVKDNHSALQWLAKDKYWCPAIK